MRIQQACTVNMRRSFLFGIVWLTLWHRTLYRNHKHMHIRIHTRSPQQSRECHTKRVPFILNYYWMRKKERDGHKKNKEKPLGGVILINSIADILCVVSKKTKSNQMNVKFKAWVNVGSVPWNFVQIPKCIYKQWK